MDSQSIYAWDSRGCIQSVLLHAGTEDTIRETVTTTLSHVLKEQSFVFLVPMNSKVLREWETRDGAPSGSNNTGVSSFSWNSIAQNRTQARSDCCMGNNITSSSCTYLGRHLSLSSSSS